MRRVGAGLFRDYLYVRARRGNNGVVDAQLGDVKAVRRAGRRLKVKGRRFPLLQHHDGRLKREGLAVRLNVDVLCESGRDGAEYESR